MRLSVLTCLLLHGCTSPLPPSNAQVTPREKIVEPAAPAQLVQTTESPSKKAQPVAVTIDTSSAKIPEAKSISIQGITFQTVFYDSRTHKLVVADQKKGPGSDFLDAKAAAASEPDILAAINAGFFTPEGKPLGFLISKGTLTGSKNSSSLGAGVYQIKNGVQSLIRQASFSKNGVQEALQSGPFLVWNKKAPSRLSNERPRARSLILTDGKHNWAIAQTSPTTLSHLGTVLSSTPFNGWTVQSALNLDGGRSCDLFVSPSISGGGIHHRSFIAKPVRNFLLLKAQ